MIARDNLAKIRTYVGADGRQIRIQAKDEDGAPYDLTGFDSATISARLGDNDWRIEEAECAIEIGVNGYLNFTPTADEISVEGEYLAQIRLVVGTAVDYLEPFILEVVAPIYNGS